MATYTNRLAQETSLYLLQHAHNPVDWYPWGPEALETARRENKPILVSIGYSACHWCHVMERESFEDPATAEVMNRYFVNIKIDREERPDLDHIYMDAVQAITGSGGWPLNVFLLPDARPFYGGTYFPPVPVQGRPSWKQVLVHMEKMFREKPHELESQATNLVAHIGDGNLSFTVPVDLPLEEEILGKITLGLLNNADTRLGGFGRAPKFPQTFSITYLLRHAHFHNDRAALDHALLSLDKMLEGGIYDQIGGGFARYSTDAEWLAPHFEKMLYDNALLIGTYAEAYQLTRLDRYEVAIGETIAWLEREMTGPDGELFAALDADSEGVEGKFYVWSRQEWDEILGPDAEWTARYFDITQSGNWEHSNIPRVVSTLETIVEELGYAVPDIAEKLAECKQKLLTARVKRIRPALDDKVLTGWNALMITALCKAFAATGNFSYRDKAMAAMRFLENHVRDDQGQWLHTYQKGRSKTPAFLDDLAYLAQAYIHLQPVICDVECFAKAKTIVEYVLENFLDESGGMFYYTGRSQTDVVVRKTEVYDGALPSGNSVMLYNLQVLSEVFGKTEWAVMAEKMLTPMLNALSKYPVSFGNWCLLLQRVLKLPCQIVAVGKGVLDSVPGLLKPYRPNVTFAVSEKPFGELSLLQGKSIESEEVRFYFCRDQACSVPLDTLGALHDLEGMVPNRQKIK